MIQTLIAYTIIITAFAYTLYQVVQFFIQSLKKSKSPCAGCPLSNCSLSKNKAKSHIPIKS